MTPQDRPLRALDLDRLRRRTSVKWRLHPEDVLPMFVAEMDVPLAEPVAAALHAAVSEGDTGYAYGPGYAEALAGFAADRWGWRLDPSATALVPDVMAGVVEMLALVTDPGDGVVVNSPVYPPFYDFVAHAGRRVVESPLGEDGRIDLAVLENTFRYVTVTSTRPAFLLCSPHNPTGVVHTAEELRQVAALCAEYAVRLVADEIHAPVVPAGHAFTPVLSLPEADDALALHSASKAWNLAGVKAALALAGPRSVDDLRRMPEVVAHGASHLGAVAHTAAYREGGPWLDAMLVDLDDHRRLLAELLAASVPGIGYRIPEGTYVAWLDCRELGLGEDPAAAFLERGRVALGSGPTFGTGGVGHARMTLATTPELLAEGVRRLAASL